MRAPLIGGSRDGTELDVAPGSPAIQVHVPAPFGASFTAEEDAPPLLATTPVETYYMVRLQPWYGDRHQRVFVHETLHRKLVRYWGKTDRRDIGDLASKLCNWIVAPDVDLERREKEIASLEYGIRIIELENLFTMPHPRDLQVEHVLAGQIWHCGDDTCNCAQAQIVTWDEQLAKALGWPRMRPQLHAVWRGPFHSEGEQGAGEDLERSREYLQLVAPNLHARIQWEKEK